MRVILLLSGGLDSTTLLWHLRAEGHDVASVGFYYEQRHAKELDAARALDPGITVLSFPRLRRVDPEIPSGHYEDESMKAIVYPSRNTVMLSLAAGVAVDRGADAVAYAAHGGDHAIYPDCRPAYIESVREVFRLANWTPLALLAPFVTWTKAQIVARGAELGVPFAATWSCYRGAALHCGTCGTCVERREAFQLAGIPDPTAYAA